MILVDTSAWIEFDRATESAVDLRLTRALEQQEPLATTGVVVLELLAGGRDDRHVTDLQRLLAGCRFLPLEEPTDHEVAAALYRACRRAGVTVRRVQDCLLAVVAMRTGSTLLHQDADFDEIARHASLQIAS